MQCFPARLLEGHKCIELLSPQASPNSLESIVSILGSVQLIMIPCTCVSARFSWRAWHGIIRKTLYCPQISALAWRHYRQPRDILSIARPEPMQSARKSTRCSLSYIIARDMKKLLRGLQQDKKDDLPHLTRTCKPGKAYCQIRIVDR
jgi:hypothetical protein